MIEQSRSSAGPWDLYQSRNYANLWYGARAAAEQLRGHALERLYRNRPNPGGPHPDPREPAAFSSQAILSVAASLLGLPITPSLVAYTTAEEQRARQHRPHDPYHSGLGHATAGGAASGEESDVDESIDESVDYDEETGQRLPFAWIVTYPPTPEGKPPPELCLRTLHADHLQLEFEVACLIGYWQHELTRLTDPDAPEGSIFLPRDPGVTALLHQYAIALLGLSKECPPSWSCRCNAIRKRFNAPPPDHKQPTGAFTVADLEQAQRPRSNTEPHLPYRDPNVWTDE